jgi:hypothetical protein
MLKGEDYPVRRYSGFQQAIGNPFFGSVMLHPDPVIVNVHMNNAAMNAPATVKGSSQRALPNRARKRNKE